MKEFLRKRCRTTSVLVSVLLFVFIGGYVVLETRNSRLLTRTEEELSAFDREVSSLNQHRAALKKIEDLQELIRFRAMLKGEPYSFLKAMHARLLSEASGRELAMRAQKRDDLLIASRDLLKINEKDPIALSYMKQAKKLHEENQLLIEGLVDIPNDCEWNARIWYLSGIENYRSLIFLKENEKTAQRDALVSALEQFKKVFICFPKQRDAEVAIELLFKESNRLKDNSGGDGSAAARRLRRFPSRRHRGINPEGRSNESTKRAPGRH